MRIDGALGFFQRASPPNNTTTTTNNNNNNKISSVWGSVPGPKMVVLQDFQFLKIYGYAVLYIYLPGKLNAKTCTGVFDEQVFLDKFYLLVCTAKV